MASVDFSTILPKLKGWTGQQYGAQGSSTWGEIATALGTDVNSLRAANSSWLSGDALTEGGGVDLSWLTQNMAGRLQTPGSTGPAITQAQSDAYLANQIATQEAANQAKFQQGILTPTDPTSAGPWITDANGRQIPNPAYTGPAVSPYDPNASMAKPAIDPYAQAKQQQAAGIQIAPPKSTPKIEVPASIPTDVFKCTATKESVLASLPNLQPGMSSPEVKKLQEELIRMGLMPTGMNTGYYGDITKAAVAKLQSTLGVDTAGNDGYFGPKTKAALSTPEGVAKLTTDIKTKTSGATDVTSAITSGNQSLKDAGIPELVIDPSTPIKTEDVPGIFTKYVAMQGEIQQNIDAAQEELTKIMSNATRGANQISGGLGVTQTLIGRQLQNLKDVVATQAQPYNDLISNLTKDLGITRDTMNTLMAYGNYVKGLNKPEYMTVGKNLIQIMPDGTVKTVYSAPASEGGGSITGTDIGYSLSPDDLKALAGTGHRDIADAYTTALASGNVVEAKNIAAQASALIYGQGGNANNVIEGVQTTPIIQKVYEKLSQSGDNAKTLATLQALSDKGSFNSTDSKTGKTTTITLTKADKVSINALIAQLTKSPPQSTQAPASPGVFSSLWDWTKSAVGMFQSIPTTGQILNGAKTAKDIMSQ
jgi:hypothetical protein